MSLTFDLVKQLESINFDRFDEEDVRVLRTLLLDQIGVEARGAATESAAAVRSSIQDLAADVSGGFPIVGTRQRVQVLGAVLANAVAGHSIEYDDVHNASSTHPGVVVLPAALGACALSGASERSFLEGAAVGYELMCRVGHAADPEAHYRRHFHPTATAGVLGAAAAAARIFGLDTERTVWAIGIAATMASGSMQFLEDGSWIKRLHPGIAARNGLQAALLARRGFRGGDDGIAGPRAFLASHSAGPRPERLLEAFGERPLEVRNTSIKAHACCRYKQGPIDALLEIRQRLSLDFEDVKSVEIGLLSAGMDIVWNPADLKRRPSSVVDAQFSMPFGAAVALAEGRAGLEQYAEDRLRSPVLESLMDRVACVTDPDLDRLYPERWGAWARVTTKDGRTHEARVADPKGDPPNPLSPDELREKFTELTQAAYSAERRTALFDVIGRLGESGTLKALVDLLPADRAD